MKFNSVTPQVVEALAAIVGPEHVVLPTAADDMLRYTHDETEDLRYIHTSLLTPLARRGG